MPYNCAIGWENSNIADSNRKQHIKIANGFEWLDQKFLKTEAPLFELVLLRYGFLNFIVEAELIGCGGAIMLL